MTDLPVERAGWFNSAQSADEDDIDHAEMEELICAARFTYCGYDDGSGDDGNPTFALIQIEGQWTSVCALHATAAAAGEMERNWTPTDLSAVPPSRDLSSDRLEEIEAWANGYRTLMRGGLDATVHTAGVLLDSDEQPSISVDDVEWLLSELRDARAEVERLAYEPHCCPPCAVHPDPEPREIERIAASIDMRQIVAQGGVDTGWLVSHVLRESGLAAERERDEARNDARVYQELYEQRVDTLVKVEAELADARAENERLRELPYLSGNWVAEEIVDDLRAKLASAEKRHNKLRSALSCVHMDLTARSVAADDLVKILELDAAALTEGGAE